MKHLLALPKTLLVPKSSHEFVVQIMNDLRAHDVETYEHCVRVSVMALQVAKELGESSEQQVLAAYSGLLHDAAAETRKYNRDSGTRPMQNAKNFNLEFLRPGSLDAGPADSFHPGLKILDFKKIRFCLSLRK